MHLWVILLDYQHLVFGISVSISTSDQKACIKQDKLTSYSIIVHKIVNKFKTTGSVFDKKRRRHYVSKGEKLEVSVVD